MQKRIVPKIAIPKILKRSSERERKSEQTKRKWQEKQFEDCSHSFPLTMAKHESEYTKRAVRKREEGDSLNQAGFSDVNAKPDLKSVKEEDKGS